MPSKYSNGIITASLERGTRERDITCVYCGVEFTPTKVLRKLLQVENILAMIQKSLLEKNIYLFCCGCNASKEQKELSICLQTKYCKECNITSENVAFAIKEVIKNRKSVKHITSTRREILAVQKGGFYVNVISSYKKNWG